MNKPALVAISSTIVSLVALSLSIYSVLTLEDQKSKLDDSLIRLSDVEAKFSKFKTDLYTILVEHDNSIFTSLDRSLSSIENEHYMRLRVDNLDNYASGTRARLVALESITTNYTLTSPPYICEIVTDSRTLKQKVFLGISKDKRKCVLNDCFNGFGEETQRSEDSYLDGSISQTYRQYNSIPNVEATCRSINPNLK